MPSQTVEEWIGGLFGLELTAISIFTKNPNSAKSALIQKLVFFETAALQEFGYLPTAPAPAQTPAAAPADLPSQVAAMGGHVTLPVAGSARPGTPVGFAPPAMQPSPRPTAADLAAKYPFGYARGGN